MKKQLTILTLLLTALTTAWAGEKTVTISRNMGQYSTGSGVYYITSGGVQLTMSGGLNNSNYLLMQPNSHITITSSKYKIKKIIFHCLDNALENDLSDHVHYWGPTTLSIGVNTDNNNEIAGTYTAPYDGNSYEGCWVSTASSSSGHVSYPDGLQEGYLLHFENKGFGVRFGSIDIVIEKEMGDIFDLVYSNSHIVDGGKYVLVNKYAKKAMSYETKFGPGYDNNSGVHIDGKSVFVGSDVELISGEVNGSTIDYAKVKVDDNAQIITLENRGTDSYNDDRPWLINVGGNYLRLDDNTFAGQYYHTTGSGTDVGYDVYAEPKPDEVDGGPNQTGDRYFCTNISIGTAYNVLIRYLNVRSSGWPVDVSSNYALRYNPNNDYFRALNYSSSNTDGTNQRTFLYKPAQNYIIFTECDPENGGYITLGDGALELVIDGVTQQTSQFGETVHFFVGTMNGYQITGVTVTDENNNVIPVTLDEDASSVLGNGYYFTMPASNVHIVASFALPTYYGITTICTPAAGGSIIMGGDVVEHDDVIEATAGSTVTFTVDTNEGYTFNSVSVTDSNGALVSYTYDEDTGVYTFIMPNDPVTITANFTEPAPEGLYLFGNANNGFWTKENGDWHAYGPEFNYNSEIGYYLDVYFKGTGSYADNTGDRYGCYFSLSKRYSHDDNWDGWVNGHRLVASESTNDNVTITEDELANANGVQKPLYADFDNGWGNGANRNSSFCVPAGIYRIIVNEQMTQMTIIRKNLSLIFDPEGGLNAAEAPYVSKGTEIAMSSALYNEIKNINNTIVTPQNTPDIDETAEPAANFFYKVSTSTDGTTYNDVTTASTTNVTTTLNTVNEGETVTEVSATNYLGWITIPGTNYYKVLETPLHWIEHPDKGVQGNNYIVSDQLIGVYAMDNILWAKDVDFDSNNANAFPDGEVIDYMKNFTTFMQNEVPNSMKSTRTEWEQKNWVQLDFTDVQDYVASDFVNKYLIAGTVKGTYVDDTNYKIRLTSVPEMTNQDAQGHILGAYQPNYYCPTNFMTYQGVTDAIGYNQDSDVSVFTNQGSTNSYYFLNPKIQEYALITFAVWNGTRFVVSDQSSSYVNGANLNGAFDVDWTYNNWDNDNDANQTSNLNDNLTVDGDEVASRAYIFHAIIQKPVAQQGNGAPARVDEVVTPKPNQTPTGNYKVYPLDLVASSDNNIVTAVSRVHTAKAVQSVTYCDLAGRTSSKPFAGVNIVITRYTDGTIVTSKQVR